MSAKHIMKQGLTAKFTQNKICFKALEATETCTIVEASPFTNLWEAGISVNDADLDNILNWIGKILVEVCKELYNWTNNKR